MSEDEFKPVYPLNRKTKLDWRNSSFRAKVTGTIISFMGATMVELYKGPLIRKSKLSSSSHPSYPTINKFLIYSSKPEYWVLGGILLATSSLSVSVWNNVQVQKYIWLAAHSIN